MRTTSLPALIRDPTGRHEFRPGFEPSPSIPPLSESSGESNSRANWPPAFPSSRYASQMPAQGFSTVSPVPIAQGQFNASPSGFHPTHLPPRRQSIPTGSSESSFSEFPGRQPTIPGAAEPRWPSYRAPGSHHPTSPPDYPTRPSSWGARRDLHGRGLLLAPSSFSNEERPPSLAGPSWTSDARRSSPRQYGEYKEGDN
ncbi:hypothetical protein FRC05_011376 [Tulasnella sp. 425]|nr:hypothetical protein FRC05_011376 [Tulasnella sp. 425]